MQDLYYEYEFALEGNSQHIDTKKAWSFYLAAPHLEVSRMT